MTVKESPRSLCPISLALELFGDAWSLLIIRDLMFKGIESYNGFLAAGEGIATNILATRLSRLETCGLIEGRPDPDDRRRTIYRLTEKGVDLAPVLVSLVLWSAKHTATDAPAELVAVMQADPSGFAGRIIADWNAARAKDTMATRS
ncbi:helix-turn-helix transcriptional regulator [Ciceribacter sp. L1K23]|uniref:winged helix-turn-helix transcriptional regulator n=1 Tax=Ciceribacter sp. L1K23 TaxID=2820276 RepID=UPI001B844156|nr:helix-turn-helix domain-containing protein [Ciceribacter sp. L1K23]MBR0556485.1 helix-turn-helix transcriptional regulator [Ciceribacter sp. L1K23]